MARILKITYESIQTQIEAHAIILGTWHNGYVSYIQVEEKSRILGLKKMSEGSFNYYVTIIWVDGVVGCCCFPLQKRAWVGQGRI